MCIPLRGVVRLVFVCFLGWIACPVEAALYKCLLADGSVLFSDAVCADGPAEPLVLIENTALDSSAERENIAQYNSPEARKQRETQKSGPRVLLIRDHGTTERNARITQEKRQVKKKSKKKRKKKPAKKQKKDMKEKPKEKTGKPDKEPAAKTR